MAETKARSVRLPDDVWAAMTELGNEHYRSTAREIELALRRYVKEENRHRRRPRRAQEEQ